VLRHVLISLTVNIVLCSNLIMIISRALHSLVFCHLSIRYEREEAFMALNLGVTSCQSLEISLDQFVRGEVLEGSNAYYCEKCKEKVLYFLPFF
jgi:ubiquitin C-terminal hydrolase